MHEEPFDERAHSYTYRFFLSGNASQRNQFHRASRFDFPQVCAIFFAISQRRNHIFMSALSPATGRIGASLRHNKSRPIPISICISRHCSESPNGVSSLSLALASLLQQISRRQFFVPTVIGALRCFTSRPATTPPAQAVPAAGNALCNPSCGSPGPNSRGTRMQGPCAVLARCDQES